MFNDDEYGPLEAAIASLPGEAEVSREMLVAVEEFVRQHPNSVEAAPVLKTLLEAIVDLELRAVDAETALEDNEETEEQPSSEERQGLPRGLPRLD